MRRFLFLTPVALLLAALVVVLATEYVVDGEFEPIIEKLFASGEVDYLQVHSTTAGCFTFRIERHIPEDQATQK